MTKEQQLKKLIEEKQFLSWILEQYTTRKISGHQSRFEHLKKMHLIELQVVRIYDLYYTTSNKLVGEEFMLFNYPELWVEYRFSRNV